MDGLPNGTKSGKIDVKITLSVHTGMMVIAKKMLAYQLAVSRPCEEFLSSVSPFSYANLL